MTPTALGQLFLEHYPIDDNGFSTIALMDDLVKINPEFRTKNGCQWARTDVSWLGKRFKIERILKSNRVYSVQLVGFNSNINNHNIPAYIAQNLERRCVVLDITSQVEIDHKDGRYEKENYELDDFQGLAKTVNDAKRQHCKECKRTGIRFNATVLGSSIPYISGDAHSTICDGCYWYDPRKFWQEATKNYKEIHE